MAPTATQGTTHGVELASGYIALSVKYGSSMSQIHKDFRGVEEQAHTSGLVAGRNIGSGIAKGAEDGAKKGRTATKRELALAEADAKTSGAKIGSALSRGIQAPVAAAAHAARVSLVGLGAVGQQALSRAGRAAEEGGKKLKEMGEEGTKSVSSILPGIGMLAPALGAIAPEAIAAGAAIGAVVAPFALLLEQGKEWGGIKNSMKFNLGIDGKQLNDMLDMVGKIGTEVPASFESISEKTIEAQKNLHLTGDTLKTIVEQAEILKNKGGIDLNMEGLGQLKRAMGSDGNDLPALLDQLYDASKKSGIGINEMIGTMASAAPLLKQMGLNAGDAATLLTQFDEAGVSVNKVLPMLNRFYRDAAKAGEPFSQFVKEQVEQLQNFIKTGDMVDAQALAEKIAGPRSAAALIQAAQSGKLNPEEWTGGEKPSTTILQAGKNAETMGDKWKEMTNGLSNMLRPYSTALMSNVSGWVKTALGNLTTYFQQHGPAIIHNIATVFNAVKPYLIDAVHFIGDVLKGIPHAVQNVQHAFSNVQHAMSNLDHAGQNVLHAWDNFTHALDNIQHAADNVRHAIGNVIHFFEVLPDKVDGFFRSLPDKIGGFFSTAAGKVSGFFSSMVDKVTNFFSGGVDKIVNFFSAIPDKIASFFSNIGDKIVDAIKGAIGSLNPFGRAGGGPLSAPGPKGVDSALFWGADGEHVLTADDVDAMGGHSAVYAFRNALHRAGGGHIGSYSDAGGEGPLRNLYDKAKELNGGPYVWGSTDCSGAVSMLVDAALGTSGRMDTHSAESWLAAKGFKMGSGPEGTFRIGWYNGGPGGGHMAATLPDGTHFESGGQHGGMMLGGSAAGAEDSEFTNHAWLPASVLFPDGSGSDSGGSNYGLGGAGGGGGGPFGGVSGGIPAGATAGTGPHGEQGYYTAADPAKVRAAEDKVTSFQDDIDKLNQEKAKAKTDVDRKKIDDEITAKQHELDDAKKKVDEAKKGEFHKLKDGKDSDGDDFWGQLGNILFKGAEESFLPPGFINPLGTPVFKTIGALFKGLGTMLGGGGGGDAFKTIASIAGGTGIGGGRDDDDTSGDPVVNPNALPGANNPAVTGDPRFQPSAAQPGQPANAAPAGNVIHYHMAPDYRGATIGHDPAQHQQSVRHDAVATRRAAGDTTRLGFNT